MSNRKEQGFSLIELLIVVVIIGIIATIALPYLTKAKLAAENGAMVATLRVMSTTQIEFYSQNSRYALLDELNNFHKGGFGNMSGNNLIRGSFTIDMGVATSSDPSLKQNFTITATRTFDAAQYPYIVSVDSSGRVAQLTP